MSCLTTFCFLAAHTSKKDLLPFRSPWRGSQWSPDTGGPAAAAAPSKPPAVAVGAVWGDAWRLCWAASRPQLCTAMGICSG